MSGGATQPDRPAATLPRLSARLTGLTGPSIDADAPANPASRLDLSGLTGDASPAVPPVEPANRSFAERLAAAAAEFPASTPKPETTVPFAEWLPDLPANSNPGATVATNVFPVTDRSYGPVKDLTAYSGALTNRAQGGLTTQDNDGNVNIFSGDDAKLYRLVSASTTWEDVSIVGGYSTGSDERWSFVQFGERIIATNFADVMQSYVIGTSTDFAALGGTPPKARYAAVIKGFVMVANTNDAGDGNQPQRVWWCADADPTDWPTIGSADAAAKQSDYQDLLGPGGWNQGIVGGLGAADGVLFQERAVYRITYQGPPTVFSILPVEGARGTPAPGSIAQLGALVFYLGEDGFYAFDGASSRAIGANKIDNTFFNDVDTGNMHRVSAAIDPINKVYSVAYPGSGSSGGAPNRILHYRWAADRWSISEIDTEILLPAQTFGETLDTLDSFGTMETLPASLDSRIWTGGSMSFGAFDTAHKLGYFTGANLAATIETGEFDGQGRRVRVDGLRVIADGGTVTASVGHRDTPQGALAYTTPTSPGTNGVCPQRVDTRYARARVSIAAGGAWSHASKVAVKAGPTSEQ